MWQSGPGCSFTVSGRRATDLGGRCGRAYDADARARLCKRAGDRDAPQGGHSCQPLSDPGVGVVSKQPTDTYLRGWGPRPGTKNIA